MLVGKMIAFGVNKNFKIKDKYGGNKNGKKKMGEF
jgi:hypothetical protein